MKDYLTTEEMVAIKDIGYSKELTMEEKAKRLNDIISYEDFIVLWDTYVSTKAYVSSYNESMVDLMLSCNSIYRLFKIWGLFEPYKNKANKLILEVK